MKQKINLRLSLIALVAVIATTIGITVVYYNLFQAQVREDLQINANLLSDTELFQSVYREAGQDIESIDTTGLAKLSADNLRVTWVAPDGTVLFDNETDASELPNHADRPEIEQALEKGSGECIRKSDTLNMNTFYYAMLLDDGTVLRVATQARSISNVFIAVAPVILIISAFILLICILLGHLLTVQLLKPIDDMAEHLDDQLEQPVYKELEPFADKIRSQHDNILAAASSRQDFTANVSHELKTPLTAISGYAELLENHMVPANQEAHIAEEIRQNAERLLLLINDIIKLSELDHTELPREFKEVDLYEITTECCQELQENARQKQVALTCIGTSVTISAEKDLLKEMIVNLIQNAIQYNKQGGYVRVMVFSENGHALFTVEDNGIGIPKDQKDRVFERFYRVDKSRSRETGGTGLGLAIVKHIAEIHQAEISLESHVGKGTKITVAF